MRVLSILALVIAGLIVTVALGINESGHIISSHWIVGVAVTLGSIFVVVRYGRWFNIGSKKQACVIAALLTCQFWAIVSAMVCGCNGWAAITFVFASIIGLMHDLSYDTSSWPTGNVNGKVAAAPSGVLTSILVPIMIYARVNETSVCAISATVIGTICLMLALYSFKKA